MYWAKSCPSHARVQGEEQLLQLVERLGHRVRAPGLLEGFLRGIEVVDDQLRLAALVLECDRGDLPVLATFLVGPGEARMRRHVEVRTEERHGLRGRRVAEHETVRAP